MAGGHAPESSDALAGALASTASGGWDPGAHPARHDPPKRITTGRRLFLAFSALVAMFLVALLFASSGLREIERALEQMRGCEERVRLALELEDAVRDQYAPGTPAESGSPGPSEPRRRARELEQLLMGRVEDPEEIRWVAEIQQAMHQLEHIIDEQRTTPSALPQGSPVTTAGYPLVALVEDRVDSFFARQHHATVRLRSEVSAIERSMVRWTLGFFLGASLFAAVVGLYIRRSVARPVARLGAGAARLARGDLHTRIEIDSDDEFGALATQFNSMTESLRRNQEAMVQAEKLAGVGRLAAGVAHELNNPLSVMLGYLALHRRNATLTGRLAADLWRVEQEALRCREIVRDLLDLSRPPGVLEPSPIDMRALCEEVVDGLRESGQLPTAKVSVEGTGMADGDRSKLRQVLVNLLKNAAEASGSDGNVNVRVASSPAAVQVAVSDSGPGISAAARARIFEPFFTTKPSGTGLGLAVSRAIARAHGGDITVGQGEVGGALFALCVPRHPEPRP